MYQVKEVNSICWEDASLWTLQVHSSHMHLSFLGPVLFLCSLCFSHSSNSSAITMEGGSVCWITDLGTLIYIWSPEIADGCNIFSSLIWQEIFSFHIIKAGTFIS